MKKFDFLRGLFNKIKIFFLILVSHFKFETNWLASLAAAEWLGTFDSETSVFVKETNKPLLHTVGAAIVKTR